MTDFVAYGVATAALLVAAFAGWHTLRGQPFSNPLFYAVCVLQVLLVALLVGSTYALAATSRDVDGLLFESYLVTIAVLCVRLLDIWKGTYV